jgi:type 1 glutamine amidotransferase
MDVKWINRNLETFPQAWVRSYGKGRVFYTGFGHRAELYRNPTVLQFYLDAIQFACGDLPADTTPSAQ